MTSLQEQQANHSLTLNAMTAADVVTLDPLSICQNATVREAAAAQFVLEFSAYYERTELTIDC